jgi:hypothetical protein
MEEWIISGRGPDYQGVALGWKNAWAFGPLVVRTAGLVCPERHRFLRPVRGPAASCMNVAGLASLAYLEVCAQPFFSLKGGVQSTIPAPSCRNVGRIVPQ